MTQNYHTPIPLASPANSAVLNAPLAQLDSQITTNATNISTNTTDITNLKNGTDSIRQLRFDADTTLTIASGAVTVTQTMHLIDTESAAASDDLETISDGSETDMLVIRIADASRVVTVKHNTGNIYLSGQQDVVLNDTRKCLALYWDGTRWFEALSHVSLRDEWTSTLYNAAEILVPRGSIKTYGLGYAANRPRLNFMPRPSSRISVMEKAAAATYASIGMAAGTNTGAGAVTEANNTDSVYVQQAIAASAGTFGGRRSSTFDLFRRQHNPYFHAKIRTGTDVANTRLWCGIFSAAVTNVDTVAGATEAAAFRYSTVAGDAGWMGVTKDATTQATPVSTGVGVAVSTAYDLEIWVDSGNGVVYFSVNGSTPVSLSSNLPQTTTELGWMVTAITTTASAKTFDISRVYVEFD